MDSYIDFAAVGQVFAYSLVAVIVVVGSFSTGALSWARGEGAKAAARPANAFFVAASVCFAIAAFGVVLGVWFILDK